MKTFIKKIILIPAHEIYLIQFQDYEIKRFVQDIKNFFYSKFFIPQGKNTKWTLKAKFISFLSIVIHALLLILITKFFNASVFLFVPIFVFLLIFLTPLFFVSLIISAILIYPFDYFVKEAVIYKAKRKIKKYRKNLKIIAITGSYGKTTMKDAISEILSDRFKLLKTEGNKNTIFGISQLVNKKLDEKIEVFIVEMAAYGVGNIKRLCDLIQQPDISILTGINESHFERFKDIQNTIKTKFEIVENCKKDGVVVLNADNELIVQNFGKYLKEQKIYFYSSKNNPLSNYKFSEKIFYEDDLRLYFEIKDEYEKLGSIKTSFLSDYIIGTSMACFVIGKEFGMSFDEIKEKIEKLIPTDHRLQPIKAKNNILIIDDSYNGNPNGVQEAIIVLSRFSSRRKIYVTPGLAEVGEKNKDLHIEIGKQLASVADMVILENNEAGRFIKEGLLKNNFFEKYIKTYPSIHEAYVDLDNILMNGDVILFQRGRSEFLFRFIGSLKISED